jgi:hypothetical protein
LREYQRKIVNSLALWNNELSAIIAYLDELTVVVFLPVSIIRLYRKRELQDWLYLLLPVIALCLSGFISGMKNGNQLIVTVLGVFDYIKNFIVIFIYAMFFRGLKYPKKLFRIMLIITIFLCFVAIIQELWAISNRYIISKDLYNISYFLSNNRAWRFGFYRASSLMHHPNMFALYTLLIFTIYLCMEKKIKLTVIIPLCTGILVSISKVAYMGLIIVMGMKVFKDRRLLVVLLLLFSLIFIFSTSFFLNFKILEQLEGEHYIFPSDAGKVSLRSYVRDRALEIWKDYPFWGIGPGMFGGVISVKYYSFIYEEYNFDSRAITLINQFRSIDQFWPQILVEMGIIGAVSFSALLVSLFILLLILRRTYNIYNNYSSLHIS